tara:strand:- start:4914 stop:5987 length:1074 start_codon:yes stop_codon:yes gene_type:complete
MTQLKYLRRKILESGRKIWVVNPPKYVKEAIGAYYEQFDDQADASARAISMADQYSDYKRCVKREIHINEETVAGLVSLYKGTNSWNKLSANSKRTYDQLLRSTMRLRVGSSSKMLQDTMIKHVSVKHAEQIYSQLCKDCSMHRANHVCKVLRRIWTVGERLGATKSNPFKNMGLKKTPSRKILWDPEEVHAFVDMADKMGLPSLGTVALLCYDLCQRPGDMRQLTWKDFSDQMFGFEQEKTKTWVDIPASPRLLARMDKVSLSNWHDYLVYYERTGKPYDRYQIGKVFRRIRNAAGLSSELQLRDLRRTGATEMAEAGCTEDELRSVTGHQSRDVLSIYVRPTKKLAAAGINKRFG